MALRWDPGRGKPRRYVPRGGMTLIELLVVISILLLVAVFTVPAIRPGLEGRRLREAARAVNVYLSAARNRAEATGRPVGVEIERLAGQPLAATTLRQLEVPPPYAGDVIGARVIVQDWTDALNSPNGKWWPDGAIVLKVKVDISQVSSGLLRVGDKVQLNHQGPTYAIGRELPGRQQPGFFDFPEEIVGTERFINFNVPNPGNYVLTLVGDPRQATSVPWPAARPDAQSGLPTNNAWSEPVPFVVYRQPVRSAAAPLRLPRGTAIDLTYSGTTTLFHPSSRGDRSSVNILFSPNGAVGRIGASGFPGDRVVEPIYLLVGRLDRVPLEPAPPFTSPAEDGRTNLEDLGNFWVAIQPQTGLVTTAEMAAGAPDITKARSIAARADSTGGR
ncbi:MAG: pilus assembly FimT family protein [Thermoguttaceae bacterium]